MLEFLLANKANERSFKNNSANNNNDDDNNTNKQQQQQAKKEGHLASFDEREQEHWRFAPTAPSWAAGQTQAAATASGAGRRATALKGIVINLSKFGLALVLLILYNQLIFYQIETVSFLFFLFFSLAFAA